MYICMYVFRLIDIMELDTQLYTIWSPNQYWVWWGWFFYLNWLRRNKYHWYDIGDELVLVKSRKFWAFSENYNSLLGYFFYQKNKQTLDQVCVYVSGIVISYDFTKNGIYNQRKNQAQQTCAKFMGRTVVVLLQFPWCPLADSPF